MATGPNELVKFLIEHPGAILSIAGLVATVAGSYFSAAALGWRAAQYLNKREIDDYKRQIEQQANEHQHDIDRISKQTESAAVIDNLFPSINELVAALLMGSIPGAQHYPDFHIALVQKPSPDPWVFSRTSLRDIYKEWFGTALESHPVLSIGYRPLSGAADEPCLLWKVDQTIVVKNSDLLKQMYPFVIARIVPHGAMPDPTTSELFNFLNFVQLWTKAIPTARFEIVKMHRAKDKAYLRGFFRFNELTIESADGRPKTYDAYYLMRQVVVIRSEQFTVIITAGLPNDNLVNYPHYPALKTWWDALRIVQ